MYIWNKFEDSIPYGYLEIELNAKGKWFCYVHSIARKVQVKANMHFCFSRSSPDVSMEQVWRPTPCDYIENELNAKDK